jgi:hypothetical protein
MSCGYYEIYYHSGPPSCYNEIMSFGSGVPRGGGGSTPPPPPANALFRQSRTGLQIGRKMFSVPIPTF